MLLNETVAVCTDNRIKQIQNVELLNVKVGGTYSYHLALKG